MDVESKEQLYHVGAGDPNKSESGCFFFTTIVARPSSGNLQEIFIRFLSVYPLCPPPIGRLSPTTLTHICRKWREIAFATPALWRAISLNFVDGTAKEQKTSLLLSWISRSRSLPLSIHADAQLSDQTVISFLVPYCARWEHLELGCIIRTNSLPLFRGPMPSLRHLNLVLAVPAAPYSPLFADAAQLRSVVLSLSVCWMLILATAHRFYSRQHASSIAGCPFGRVVLRLTSPFPPSNRWLLHFWMPLCSDISSPSTFRPFVLSELRTTFCGTTLSAPSRRSFRNPGVRLATCAL
ncbi:hypothetical protein C8R43DRAFT_1244607 [Mycena crocata]|nr:hypothetical protein C8R43DRAFT_1244607 [Mycena crocata]